MITKIILHYPPDAPKAISTTPGGLSIETLRPTVEVCLELTRVEEALFNKNNFTSDMMAQTQFRGAIAHHGDAFSFHVTPVEQDDLRLRTYDEIASYFYQAANLLYTRYRRQ